MKSQPSPSYQLPPSFQVLPEWIERTNDSTLLTLALNHPQNSSLVKSLIVSKLSSLSQPDQPEKVVIGNTEKETGNSFMKAQQFPEAIMHYTYSLIYNPKESTTYCNRALAYTRQSNFQKGVYDCTNAIYLNNKYTKAYYRRAICYSNLKKYQNALDDLLYLCDTNNSTKEIEMEIDSVVSKFRKDIGESNWKNIESDIKRKIELAKTQKAGIINPLELSVELKTNFNDWETKANNIKKDLVELLDKKDFIKASQIVKACYEQCDKFKEKFSDKTKEHIKILLAMGELNSYQVIIDYAISLKEKEMKEEAKKKKLNAHVDKFYKTTILSKEQREKATKIAEQDIKFDDFIGNPFSFEKGFNSFKNRNDILFDFLKFCGGKRIATIYSRSEIPFQVMNGIIKCLNTKAESIKDNNNMFYDYFESFTKIKGFDLVKNFISKNDKNAIANMLDKIKEIDANKGGDCDKLKKMYL